MVIQTKAPDRKTLVKAISEHLGQEAHYNGPPTFSYSIGPVTVDREGLVSAPDDMDAKDLKTLLSSNGWLDPELDRLTISVPANDLTVKAMHNLILMLYSKQYLLGKAIKANTIQIAEAVIMRLNESLSENPTDFKALMDDFRARGQITGVDFADDSVSLSFPLSDMPEIIQAYTQLTANIIAAAKAATRVHPELQQPENEKYHMRSWLVRLGLGGKNAKGVRDMLLKNLKGHSAFRSDLEAQKHRDKYAAIGRSHKESLSTEVQHEEG